MTNSTKRSMMMVAAMGLATLAGPAKAGMVVSAEAAKVQATTVSGVTTETFNGFSPGTYTTLNTAVGTLTSPGLAIVAANLYGGASAPAIPAGSASEYFAIGAESGQTAASLALNGAQSYFGFWWSAADGLNSLQFYSKGNLVATFNPATAIGDLGSSYLGNPNTGADAGEKFAYLDFTTTGGTTFDQVVFNNSSTGTGFEADNFSVLSTAVTPTAAVLPGAITNAAVPEPSSLALASLGGAIGLGAARIRRRSSAAA